MTVAYFKEKNDYDYDYENKTILFDVKNTLSDKCFCKISKE